VVAAPGTVIALFPGQGSQYVGMGKALYESAPAARAVIDRADAALGISLSKIMFEGPIEELTLTHNAQPAILTHSLAALACLEEAGFVPAAAAGHSLGEYSAYVAAGALSVETAVRLVRRRGQLMLEAGQARPGTMAAVLGLSEEQLRAVCAEAASAGVVVPANLNSPGQIVISGEIAGVEKAMELAPGHGAKKVVRLPVSGAFHSPLMEPAATGLRAALADAEVAPARFPVVANLSARPVLEPPAVRESLAGQLTGAVRWEDVMKRLAADHGSRFVEVGPGKVLRGLARSIDRSWSVDSVEDPDGVEAFLGASGGSVEEA